MRCGLVTPPDFGECAGTWGFVVLHKPLARALVVADINADASYFVLGAGCKSLVCSVIASRRVRRCCRNRGGLLRKQRACGKCGALQTTDNRHQGGTELYRHLCVLLLLLFETDK